MALKGYMIVKLRKTLNIYLFGEDLEEIEWAFETVGHTKGERIVPYYEEGNRRYIVLDGEQIDIERG